VSADWDDPAAQLARFAALRERGERVKAELAATEATASDGTGAVTVTVGAGGVMRSVRFAESARKLPMDKLSSQLMHAYLQACRAAAEQSVAIMSELVGPDSPSLQLMRDAIPPAPEEEGR
jgi:DNA-binding protein YbaB